MSADRLAEITALVARCRVRLSPERAYALITACQDLLDDKYPRTIHVEAGGPSRAEGPQSARRGLERLFGEQMPLFGAASEHNR